MGDGISGGSIFDADIRNFQSTLLSSQDILDMREAPPEVLGRFIIDAFQYGNISLGDIALGVLASAATEPVPLEVKKGLLGRERTIYDQDAEQLQARRRAVLGRFLPNFALVDFETSTADVTVEVTLGDSQFGMRNY